MNKGLTVKEFKVDFTNAENGWLYSGEWETEIVEASSEEEAIELIMQYHFDNDINPNGFRYKVRQ